MGSTAAAAASEAPRIPTALRGLRREELRRWLVEEVGERAFRGDQLFEWLHARGVREYDEMSNLPRRLREWLAETVPLGGLALDEVLHAQDGTRKLVLRTADGHRIESVLIPQAWHEDGKGPGRRGEGSQTQCISSQVGCRIGCEFCFTAQMTTRRNLSSAEIVDQVLWAKRVIGEDERIGNLVYMGMGEPLDNYKEVVESIRILLDDKGQDFAGRRITVSTSGVAPKIPRLGADVPVNLALSLNASTDRQRSQMIPINKVWPLARLVEALRAYPLPPRRRITVEYVLLRGVNDTLEDVRRLERLLAPLRRRIKINLIPFNPWPGAPYERPNDERVEAFGKRLRDARYLVTVRQSRGEDIGAACGQLDGDQGA